MKIGDEITVQGVCKGGVIHVGAPPERLQLWRVKRFDFGEIIVEPMASPGVLDTFNAAAGDFRLSMFANGPYAYLGQF